MKKTTIKIVKNEAKFLFALEDRTKAVVIEISSILEGGIPIDAETGDDLVYLGRVADDFPDGDVDLTKYDLPA